MEEKRMRELGLEGLTSSELMERGGISFQGIVKCIHKIRTVLYFIETYLPSLLKGVRDGYNEAPAK